MQSNFTSANQVESTVQLLQQEPEIRRKKDYYEQALRNTVALIAACEEQILVAPNNYEKTKLAIEKQEAEMKLQAQQNYYEQWLERSKEYEKTFAELTTECEANFEEVYQQAVKMDIAGKDPIFKQAFESYDKQKDNQKLKNEFYIILRTQVNKHKKQKELAKVK